MGKKKTPRKTTALLKVRSGAADSEYAQGFRKWLDLFGAQFPRIVFQSTSKEGMFLPEALDPQKMKEGESYLIVDSVGGTFIGAVQDDRVVSIGGRLPEPGRLYHLIRMGRA